MRDKPKRNIKRLVSHSSSNEWLDQSNRVAYMGIDPTANSLHIGHLIPLQLLDELCDLGWKIVILLGGFTGKIGDPSGKSATRNALTSDIVDNNTNSLVNMIKRILPPGDRIIYVNNINWLGEMRLGDFLDFVSNMSVNRLIGMDTFKNRLEQQQHLALSEFCYSSCQAIDFSKLFELHGVTTQIGGHDQWGNISTGVSVVKKIHKGVDFFGVTTHLLEIGGKKIGKSTGHNLQLNQTPLDLFKNIFTLPDNVIKLMLHLLMDQFYLEEEHEQNRLYLIKYIFSISGYRNFLEINSQYKLLMEGKSNNYIKTGNNLLSAILVNQLKISSSEAKRRIQNIVYINDEPAKDNLTLREGRHIIRYSKKQPPIYIDIRYNISPLV